MRAARFLSSPSAAFNRQRLLKALQLSSAKGSVALCIHSLLAQAGPITRRTHAWDRPSVIQIVCTTYGSSTAEQTWQPLIGAALSVGQASRERAESTAQPAEGSEGSRGKGWDDGEGVKRRTGKGGWKKVGNRDDRRRGRNSFPTKFHLTESVLISCWELVAEHCITACVCFTLNVWQTAPSKIRHKVTRHHGGMRCNVAHRFSWGPLFSDTCPTLTFLALEVKLQQRHPSPALIGRMFAR